MLICLKLKVNNNVLNCVAWCVDSSYWWICQRKWRVYRDRSHFLAQAARHELSYNEKSPLDAGIFLPTAAFQCIYLAVAIFCCSLGSREIVSFVVFAYPCSRMHRTVAPVLSVMRNIPERTRKSGWNSNGAGYNNAIAVLLLNGFVFFENSAMSFCKSCLAPPGFFLVRI